MKWDMANTYQEKAGHLLKQGLIGFLIGLVLTFTLLLESGEVLGWLFLGLLFAGIPYGWELTGRLFGAIVGSIPVMVIAFLLRLTAAYLVGLFLYPVVLLYNLIRGYIWVLRLSITITIFLAIGYCLVSSHSICFAQS